MRCSTVLHTVRDKSPRQHLHGSAFLTRTDFCHSIIYYVGNVNSFNVVCQRYHDVAVTHDCLLVFFLRGSQQARLTSSSA